MELRKAQGQPQLHVPEGSSPSAPAKPSSLVYQGLRAIFIPGFSGSFYAKKAGFLTFF